MKVRQDFVTNSSSSSYICIAKVDYCDRLREHMKEEFGKYGVRALEDNLIKGSDIDPDNGYDPIDDYFADNREALDQNAHYLCASFISWTSDGDTEGDDAWIWRHMPREYMTVIYEEEVYD